MKKLTVSDAQEIYKMAKAEPLRLIEVAYQKGFEAGKADAEKKDKCTTK